MTARLYIVEQPETGTPQRYSVREERLGEFQKKYPNATELLPYQIYDALSGKRREGFRPISGDLETMERRLRCEQTELRREHKTLRVPQWFKDRIVEAKAKKERIAAGREAVAAIPQLSTDKPFGLVFVEPDPKSPQAFNQLLGRVSGGQPQQPVGAGAGGPQGDPWQKLVQDTVAANTLKGTYGPPEAPPVAPAQAALPPRLAVAPGGLSGPTGLTPAMPPPREVGPVLREPTALDRFGAVTGRALGPVRELLMPRDSEETLAISRPFAQLGTSMLVTMPRAFAEGQLRPHEGWSRYVTPFKNIGDVAQSVDRIMPGNRFSAKIDQWAKRASQPTRIESDLAADYQERMDEKIENDDVAGAVYQALTEGGLEVAGGLLQLYMFSSLVPHTAALPGAAAHGKMGMAARRALAANSAFHATRAMLFTLGSHEERLKTAGLLSIYYNTPQLAGLAKTKIGSVLLDNLLNASVSTFIARSYPEAWKEARAIAGKKGGSPWKYLFTTGAAKTLISDVVSTLATRPIRADGKTVTVDPSKLPEMVESGEVEMLKPQMPESAEIGPRRPGEKPGTFDVTVRTTPTVEEVLREVADASQIGAQVEGRGRGEVVEPGAEERLRVRLAAEDRMATAAREPAQPVARPPEAPTPGREGTPPIAPISEGPPAPTIPEQPARARATTPITEIPAPARPPETTVPTAQRQPTQAEPEVPPVATEGRPPTPEARIAQMATPETLRPEKGRTVLLAIRADGKPYVKPNKAVIVQQIDEETVRIRWKPSGAPGQITEDVAIGRLQERPSTVGLRRRAEFQEQRAAEGKPQTVGDKIPATKYTKDGGTNPAAEALPVGTRVVTADGNIYAKAENGQWVHQHHLKVAGNSQAGQRPLNDSGVGGAKILRVGYDELTKPTEEAALKVVEPEGTKPAPSAGEGKPTELELARQTPADIEADRLAQERREAKAGMAAEIEAPLTARGVDATGDLYDRGKAEAPLFAAPTPKVTQRPPQDLSGKQRAGYVYVPPSRSLDTAVGRIRQAAARYFSRYHGLGRELSSVIQKYRAGVVAAGLDNKAFRRRFQLGLRELTRAGHNKDQVITDFQNVIYGDGTPADFIAKYDLKPGDAAAQAVTRFIEARTKLQQDIVDAGEKFGLPEKLQQKIKDNEFYITRSYQRFLAPDQFEPDPQDYRSALEEVKAGLADSLERFESKATKVRGERVNFDVVTFLETGEQTMLQGLSKTRQKAAVVLQHRYSQLKDVIESLYLDGDTVRASVKADALESAADSIVQYYLTREAPMAPQMGIDISHLRPRFLEEAFRRLYGEITDPKLAAGITIEVQGKLLSQLTMMNELTREGEGKWWSNLPNKDLGHMVRLGEAKNPLHRLKFGDLAGKYVARDLAEVLMPPRAGTRPSWAQSFGDLYKTLLAEHRLMAVLHARPAMRNYLNDYQYPLMAGDLTRKGYAANLVKAHKLLYDYMRRDPNAMDVVADLAREDVFHENIASINADISGLLTGPSGSLATGQLKKIMAKAGNLYSYIDFPSRVAGYWTRLEHGMSREQATDHIRRHYQYRRAQPRAVMAASKLPIADFIGFRVNAMQIRAAGLVDAIKASREGSWHEPVGFALASSWSAFQAAARMTGWGAAFVAGWAAVQQGLRKFGGDDKPDETAVLELDDHVALRKLLPFYDKESVLGMWEERKNGQRVLYYTVFNNLSVFPNDDVWASFIQRTGEEGIAAGSQAAADVLANQYLRPGMLAQNVYKTLTGDELAIGAEARRSKGIMDITGTQDPDRNRIVAESLGGFAARATGQYGTSIRNLLILDRRDENGQEPMAGSYVRESSKADVISRMFRLLRTYKLDEQNMSIQLKQSIYPIAETLKVVHARIGEPGREELRLGRPSQEKVDRLGDLQHIRIELLNEANEILSAVRHLDKRKEWFDDAKLVAIVRDAGMNKDDAWALVIGYQPSEYVPRAPKPTQYQRTVR